eukprot:scaffold1380_cov374-Prasinococcus_capsulatus_cf.AAC.3
MQRPVPCLGDPALRRLRQKHARRAPGARRAVQGDGADVPAGAPQLRLLAPGRPPALPPHALRVQQPHLAALRRVLQGARDEDRGPGRQATHPSIHPPAPRRAGSTSPRGQDVLHACVRYREQDGRPLRAVDGQRGGRRGPLPAAEAIQALGEVELLVHGALVELAGLPGDQDAAPRRDGRRGHVRVSDSFPLGYLPAMLEHPLLVQQGGAGCTPRTLVCAAASHAGRQVAGHAADAFGSRLVRTNVSLRWPRGPGRKIMIHRRVRIAGGRVSQRRQQAALLRQREQSYEAEGCDAGRLAS